MKMESRKPTKFKKETYEKASFLAFAASLPCCKCLMLSLVPKKIGNDLGRLKASGGWGKCKLNIPSDKQACFGL